MSELPEPVARLYRYFTATAIAHETIYELHSEVVEAGGDLTRARALLDEGARIALTDMRQVADAPLDLARRYQDLEVLDSHGAAAVLSDIETALAAVEDRLKALRSRQNEIARELANLLDAEG